MFNIALVDDEIIFLEKIEKLISKIDKNINIYCFKSASEMLKRISYIKIDLAILDINLGDFDGISLSRKLNNIDKKSYIIFLTSTDQYMKNAFGVNVYKYILKSEMDTELIKSIKDIIAIKDCENQTCTFHAGSSIYVVNLEEIICFERINRKIYLYFKEQKIELNSTYTIKCINSNLNSMNFQNPNSGTIVNLKYVQKISKESILLNKIDKVISVSRGRYKQIYNAFTNFLINGDML